MMVKLDFKWVKKTARYQTGEFLYLNRICVGGYEWNSARSQSNKDTSINWAGHIDLLALSNKAKRVYGSDETEVKTKVEQVVTRWFNEALKS